MSEYENNNEATLTPEELLIKARQKAWESLLEVDRRFYWTMAGEVEPAFLTKVTELIDGYKERLNDAKDAVQDWIQSSEPETLEGYHEQTMLGRLETSLGIETEIEVDFEVEAKISITTKRKVWEKQSAFVDDLIEALDIRVHNDVDYSVDRVDEV